MPESSQITALAAIAEIGELAESRVTGLLAIVEREVPQATDRLPEIIFNNTDLTSFINQAKLEAVINAINSTVFSSTGEEAHPGLGLWALPMGGLWDIELDDSMYPLIGQYGALTVTILTIRYGWANAFIGDYRITSEAPNAGIIWFSTLVGVNKPVRTVLT